jgi:hypothetical protein
MTFVNTPRKVLLFLSLIILSCALSKSKSVLKKSAVSAIEMNKDGLKKYLEIGLDVATFEDNQKKCWNYVWGDGFQNYQKFLTELWTTTIEKFIQNPSQEKLDLQSHLNSLINDNVKNEVKIDPTQNTVTCQTYLNSKRKQNLTPDVIKNGAMAAFNIILPARTAGPKLFVTSSITSHRDIVPNKDIFKVLNGNKQA